MTEELEKKGIAVNKESLATRVKNPRRIADLEEAQDRKFKEEMGISDDSDDESVMSDEDMKKQEGEERGRKAKRAAEKQSKTP